MDGIGKLKKNVIDMKKELCKPCYSFSNVIVSGSKLPHVNDRIKCDLKSYEDSLSDSEKKILEEIKEQSI